MATCPGCGKSTRTNPGLMTIEPILDIRPPGTHSLAGVGIKVAARELWRLACRCGWTATGHVNGGEFIAHQQTSPPTYTAYAGTCQHCGQPYEAGATIRTIHHADGTGGTLGPCCESR